MNADELRELADKLEELNDLKDKLEEAMCLADLDIMPSHHGSM